MLQWINDKTRRYYRADFTDDLFGGVGLMLSWGGLNSRRGSAKSHWYPTMEAAKEAVNDLCRRRFRHGYVLELDPWTYDQCSNSDPGQ